MFALQRLCWLLVHNQRDRRERKKEEEDNLYRAHCKLIQQPDCVAIFIFRSFGIFILIFIHKLRLFFRFAFRFFLSSFLLLLHLLLVFGAAIKRLLLFISSIGYHQQKKDKRKFYQFTQEPKWIQQRELSDARAKHAICTSRHRDSWVRATEKKNSQNIHFVTR